MTIWLDNHLSPALAVWIGEEFGEEFGEPCVQIRDLQMARAPDPEIFTSARSGARILITKDRDFADLVSRLGPPPSVILLTTGNTSTAYLKTILKERLSAAFVLIEAGEPLVEIGGS